MVLFVVLTVAVIVALFAWAPWNDDTVGNGRGTGTEENTDININDGNNQQTQPAQSP